MSTIVTRNWGVPAGKLRIRPLKIEDTLILNRVYGKHNFWFRMKMIRMCHICTSQFRFPLEDLKILYLIHKFDNLIARYQI